MARFEYCFHRIAWLQSSRLHLWRRRAHGHHISRPPPTRSIPISLFAGEAPQDWLMQCYPVSYFRIDNGSHPVCRYIDSQAPLIVAVTGFDDREMLNLILLHRYIISYEPYHFKGHVGDFPLTSGLRQED